MLQLHFRFTTADAHRVRSRDLQRSNGKEPEEQPTQKQGEVCDGWWIERVLSQGFFCSCVLFVESDFQSLEESWCMPAKWWKNCWPTVQNSMLPKFFRQEILGTPFSTLVLQSFWMLRQVLAVSPQCTHRGRRLTPVLRDSSLESRI